MNRKKTLHMTIFDGFYRSLYFMLCVVFSFLILLQAVPMKASAATKAATYYLYWNDSNTNSLKKIFDDGEKSDEIGSQMVITAKGDMFGDKGRTFSFQGINKQLNERSGNDISDQYYAVTKLYCADNKLTLDKPQSSSAGYIEEIDYTVGFHVDNWGELEKSTTQELYGGVTRVYKISTAAGAADQETYKRTTEEQVNVTKLGDDNDWGGHGGNPKDHIDPGCWDELSNGRIGNVKNYYKLPADEKKVVDAIVKTSPAAAGADGGEDEKDPCISNSGDLGWIMCPVIETGLKATDFVFSNFIQPMLENVPVEAEDGNGAYEAWKQFRTLGNIVLIGTLIAVVYAQARGER